MKRRVYPALFFVLGVSWLAGGCSDHATCPTDSPSYETVQLTQPLEFAVTLVDENGRVVGTRTYEVWDAESAWAIEELIDSAPDCADSRTSDRTTLEGIRMIVTEMEERQNPDGLRLSPMSGMEVIETTWGGIKARYRSRPPKPDG